MSNKTDRQLEIKRTKHFVVDDIWGMLILSLPEDAENLSTLTANQALKVLENFKKRLKNYD